MGGVLRTITRGSNRLVDRPRTRFPCVQPAWQEMAEPVNPILRLRGCERHVSVVQKGNGSGVEKLGEWSRQAIGYEDGWLDALAGFIEARGREIGIEPENITQIQVTPVQAGKGIIATGAQYEHLEIVIVHGVGERAEGKSVTAFSCNPGDAQIAYFDRTGGQSSEPFFIYANLFPIAQGSSTEGIGILEGWFAEREGGWHALICHVVAEVIEKWVPPERIASLEIGQPEVRKTVTRTATSVPVIIHFRDGSSKRFTVSDNQYDSKYVDHIGPTACPLGGPNTVIAQSIRI